MTETDTIRAVRCPKCGAAVPCRGDGSIRCGLCRWRGLAYLFTPVALDDSGPEVAIPGDAVCLHHPSKRAVAVCEGTGDYICSLCSIEVNGQTYSAEYLNRQREKGKNTFSRRLERPDRQIGTMLLLSILFFPIFLFTIPFSVYLLAKAVRLRRKDPLYARMVGPVQLAVEGLLVAGIAAGIGSIFFVLFRMGL